MQLSINWEITAYIVPKNKYLAISQDKKTFITPSLENVQKCKSIGDTRICNGFPPVLRVTNDSRCEVKILAGLKYNTHECNIKVQVLRETLFIELEKQNSWAFTVPKGDQITIECNQKPDMTEELPPMGIVSLEPGCRASTRLAKFRAQQVLQTVLETKLFEEIPINLSRIFKETFEKSDPEVAKILSDDIIKNKGHFDSSNWQNGKDLQLLIEKAKILGEYKQLRNRMPDKSSFFIYLMIIAFLIITIIILLAGIKFFVFRDKKVFNLLRYWNTKQETQTYMPANEADPWDDAKEVHQKPILIIPRSQAAYPSTSIVQNPIHRGKLLKIQATNV